MGQFLLYLDAAQDRLSDAAAVRVMELANATRVAYHANRQAWQRWVGKQQKRMRRAVGTALTGEALERAIMGLANRNPEYVIGAGQ